MNSLAIVTGASRGIGDATALPLARDFSAIALASRSGERLAKVGDNVKAVGAEPLVIEADRARPFAWTAERCEHHGKSGEYDE